MAQVQIDETNLNSESSFVIFCLVKNTIFFADVSSLHTHLVTETTGAVRLPPLVVKSITRLLNIAFGM